MICEYEKTWPEKFVREKWLLRGVLGERIVNIHHVGSTAVPGLAARPVIDIAVESTEFPPGPDTEEILGSLEYVPDSNRDNNEIHCFKKNGPESFCLYWHPMYPSGADSVKNQLKFRDMLRDNPRTAERYVVIKKLLAGEFRHARREYDLHKGAVIDVMLKMADIGV